MSLKNKLKYSKIFGSTYVKLKAVRDEIRRRHRLHGKYKFEDRSMGSDTLCIVLAGYKEYLYPAVLGRLKKYAPADMDICIMTAGLYSLDMSKRCAENGWSYLSTSRNSASLIQNIAIHLHPKAAYIFKLDEDIFITEGYFENMIRAYHHAEEGDYIPGVIAPIITINSYGHVRVLQKFDLVETYTKLFQKPKYYLGPGALYHAEPAAARFFWGEGDYVPSIDEMNRRVSCEMLEERACSIHFSIGAIMFTREFWDYFGQYPVPRGFGDDEDRLGIFCERYSRPIMVTENVIVGHMSYKPQNAAMKEYYLSHQKQFMPPETTGGGNTPF